MRRRSPLIALAIASMGCRSGDGPVSPVATSIVTSPPAIVLRQKEAAAIAAAAVDGSGATLPGYPLTFRAADSSLVTVDAVGVVTSVGPAGATTITIAGKGVSRDVPVTITPVAASVRLGPTPLAVPQKGSVGLSAELLDLVGAPIAGSGGGFTFTSSDPAIATVSADGVVRSVGPAGAATITARSGTFSATIVANVAPQVATLAVASPVIRLAVRTRSSVGARLLDLVGAEVPDAPLAYAVADPSVATVASDGVVTGVNVGTTTVRVTGAGLGAEATIVVSTVSHPGATLTTLLIVCAPRAAVGLMEAFVYPCHNGPHGLERLDTRTLTSQVLPVPLATPTAIGVNPAGSRFFVADVFPSPRLWVLDAATGAPIGDPFELPLPPGEQMVVSPDGNTAYVSSAGFFVMVVDLTARRFTHMLYAGSTVTQLALSPDGRRLYAGGETLSEIDVAVNGIRTLSAPTASPTKGVALSPDGRTVYYTSAPVTSQRLFAADAASGEVRWWVEVPCTPQRVVIAPDHARAYVGCAPGLVVVDLDQHTVIDRRSLEIGAWLTLTADGSALLLPSGPYYHHVLH